MTIIKSIFGFSVLALGLSACMHVEPAEASHTIRNAHKVEYGVFVETNGVVEFEKQEENSTINELERNFMPFGNALDAQLAPRYPSYEIDEGTKDSRTGSFIAFSVIEPDERVAVTNTLAFPESATVHIRFQNSQGKTYGCSGAFIAHNFVLTAGHCLFENGEWSKNIIVSPGRNGLAEPFGTCMVDDAFALDEWINSNDQVDRREYDLGGMRLNCSVGADTGLYTIKSNVSQTSSVTVRGYPCDRVPNKQYYSSKENFASLTDRKAFYKNDTYGCMSGGPVVDRSGDLVAIHTNGLHNGEPWRSNNAATRLTPQFIEVVEGWLEQ